MTDAEAKANYQVIKIVRRAREFTRPYANDISIWRTKAVRLMQRAELAQTGADDARAVWQDLQGLMSVVLQRHAAFTRATQDESAEVLRNEMVGAVEKAFLMLTDNLARTRSLLGAPTAQPNEAAAPKPSLVQDGVH